MRGFFDRHIYPNEAHHHEELYQRRQAGTAWEPMTLIDELKPLARQAGLWNLFLPHSHRAPEGLSNLDYAPLCELMGRVTWSAEVFNCNAPDTGNMETIEHYGSEAHQDRWLEPLLRGEIRSAFLMTEPAVASSDATNIQCRIERDGDHYVINGRKWWSSGAGVSNCAVFIVMGKTDPDGPRYAQQSMVLVPRDTPGAWQARAGQGQSHDRHRRLNGRPAPPTQQARGRGALSGKSRPRGRLALARSGRPRWRWGDSG